MRDKKSKQLQGLVLRISEFGSKIIWATYKDDMPFGLQIDLSGRYLTLRLFRTNGSQLCIVQGFSDNKGIIRQIHSEGLFAHDLERTLVELKLDDDE